MPNKLTIDQINDLALNLTFPYHYVKLMCDGYAISLAVERKTKNGMSYCVMTYINDQFKGAWYSPSNPCPEQKFMNKKTVPLYRRADLIKMEKEHGKRWLRWFIKKYQKKCVTYSPVWPSGKTALTHLNRVCESIEIVESI